MTDMTTQRTAALMLTMDLVIPWIGPKITAASPIAADRMALTEIRAW
jgi:hypothetical protein